VLRADGKLHIPLGILFYNKKHLKNVGPIRYCEPFYIVIHQGSLLPPLSHAACASMSTTTTTTTTTRNRGDRYGPMEWAQRIQCNLLVVCIKIHTVCTTMTCLPAAAAAAVPGPRRSADDDGSHCSTCWSRGPVTSCPLSDAASWWRHCRCSCLYRETDPTINIIPSN